MTTYYMGGQFKDILRYLAEEPDWFILAGPADGDEAHCARKKWPAIKTVGLEPCGVLWDWQIRNGWPKDAPLLRAALAETMGVVRLRDGGGPTADPLQQYRTAHTRSPEAEGQDVPSVTLDHLDRTYGPFQRALIWMDIEGAELAALRGGRGLFGRGGVSAVSVECLGRDDAERARVLEIHDFLAGHGLAYVGMNERNGNDRVYVRNQA